MLVLLPLMLPIVVSLGGDLVWFGIVTVVAVEDWAADATTSVCGLLRQGHAFARTATLSDMFRCVAVCS